MMAWGLWGYVSGVMGVCGDGVGLWVESPGCDGVGLWGYVSGVMGVMIIFLSLLMVTTGSWGRGACDGISLKS